MKRLRLIRDERGMTLVELLVATAAGAIVFMGLTVVVIGSMHQTTRINNRVHATQDARTALHRIVTELHSSCVAPDVAPVQGGSTDTSLSFIYQTGSAAAPVPVLRKVSLSGTTLSESVYPSNGGTAPNWTFSSTPSSTTALMTRAGAVSGSIPVFSYYSYSNGQISSSSLATPLNATNAALTMQVNIALKASPPGTPVVDAKGAGIVQDSALLRFTSPSFNTSAGNLPCE